MDIDACPDSYMLYLSSSYCPDQFPSNRASNFTNRLARDILGATSYEVRLVKVHFRGWKPKLAYLQTQIIDGQPVGDRLLPLLDVLYDPPSVVSYTQGPYIQVNVTPLRAVVITLTDEADRVLVCPTEARTDVIFHLKKRK